MEPESSLLCSQEPTTGPYPGHHLTTLKLKASPRLQRFIHLLFKVQW